MDTDYYVYERFRKDNNTCFYVGMGHNDRYKYKHRNKLYDYIYNSYGCETRIYKDKLSKDEAIELEKKRIKYYVDDLGYGINIGNKIDLTTNMFLTNGSYGGEDGYFKSGSENTQYGVSIKERTGVNYDRWLEHQRERLCAQTGEKNPNYHNDTLHKKLEKHPELKKEYYSRPGGQNGRAVKLKLFDSEHNYIDTFDTIGDCAEYINKTVGSNSELNGVRSNIRIRMKKGMSYKGFYFEEI